VADVIHDLRALMRLVLFAGFLGSGKTTLILALARRVAASGLRIAVIVNEVGEVGVDGEVLRVGDLQVKEITGGCICCQIGPDLVRTLIDLDGWFYPDLVVVEASGIAAPPGVLDALRYYPAEKLASVQTVTVVDAARFTELYEVITPLIDSQILGADRVVVTKADEAGATEVQAALEAVRRLAPEVPVHVVDATDDHDLGPLLDGLLGPPEEGR
jgi:G3E family GTPase